jgi:hypothetical protein
MLDQVVNLDAPLCPRCGAEMKPNRSLPALGGRPALEIFECSVCEEFVTRVKGLSVRSSIGIGAAPKPL